MLSTTVWLALALAIACGKKGPPRPPLRPAPARVEDLTVRRLDNDVFLQFTIPARNADNTTPADVVRMEAYAITGKPEDPSGRSFDQREFLKYGTPVARMDVRPPPPPPPKEGPEPPPPPPDPRPAQGEKVTLLERLQTDAWTPFEHPDQAKYAANRRLPEPMAVLRPLSRPLVAARAEPLSRVYVVTGRSKHGAAGALSARLAVPLIDVPDPPSAPVVTYDETHLHLQWVPPPTARRRSQDATSAPTPAAATPPAGAPAPGTPADSASQAAPVPAPPPLLSAHALFPGAIPHTYNVYEYLAPTAGQVVTMPTPINPAPLDALTFDDARLAFGTERCYVVRTVEARGTVTVESAPSPPVCVTPRDTFPPAAPRSLAAVGAEGAVNLIWEPNTEGDLAGYLVLRGVAPGTRLEALTPTPIHDTTFRDATIQPGVRYVYAVVAVDSATPQNVSVESNRVEETGR